MICLSREELVELTGYKRPSFIGRWLRDNGFEYRYGADGWPRVIREGALVMPRTLTKSAPNVAALKELQDGKAKKVQARPS